MCESFEFQICNTELPVQFCVMSRLALGVGFSKDWRWEQCIWAKSKLVQVWSWFLLTWFLIHSEWILPWVFKAIGLVSPSICALKILCSLFSTFWCRWNLSSINIRYILPYLFIQLCNCDIVYHYTLIVLVFIFRFFEDCSYDLWVSVVCG